MKQIESIILCCLKKLNKERTVYSIFHLLNGKKSSQTIQDAHFFSLKKFFGIVDPLKRESFDQIIHSMESAGLILRAREQRFFPTAAGEMFLETNPLPEYINGWRYQSITIPFWERLSLFIQVVSNLAFEDTHYTPVQKNKDVQAWVKTVLKNINQPRAQIGPMIYEEMINCFNKQCIDPSLLIFRLTGSKQIGLTEKQAAIKFNLDHLEYHIWFTNTIHYMIHIVTHQTGEFPILSNLITGLRSDNDLTFSTRKTWDLLLNGYSSEMIANQRQLKMSTIEDHLVELALHLEDFSINEYVDQSLQEQILGISRQLKTRQLKQIKNNVNDASYFQIRLVLAKFGV